MLKWFVHEAPCALLLGGFDGLHRGHRVLVEAAQKTGYHVGLTTIFGGKEGGELFTLAERERIFRRAGLAFFWAFSFTQEMKNTPAPDFLQTLLARLPVRALVCGEDFRFGREAAGTPQLLQRLAPCPVHVLPPLLEGGEKISVSRMKELLLCGDMGGLNALLGEEYFLAGVVEHGRQVGRQYGFPTLNLTIPAEKCSPREGVYAGHCRTPAGDFPAILNVGARPTFGVEEKKLEVYLSGFSGDLYGAEVEVYPTRFLRPVVRFSSAEELRAQLERDKQSIV